MTNNLNNKIYDNLIITAAPHVVISLDTQKIMLYVIIALMPALFVGAYVFGIRAIILTIVCVISCVSFEYAFCKIAKWKNSIPDLSAVVTGIILAYNLPANFPYWMAIIGCFVAIVVAKEFFGGLGQNFVNPAVLGRIFLLVSFSSEMTSWPTPRTYGVDAVTSPTPLKIFADGGELPRNFDLFIGNIGGSFGEVSAAAILLGGVFLFVKKIISPLIPLVFLGTIFAFSLAVGVDPWFQIFSGAAMITAFFCATDYVTCPMLALGKIIFAVGCGLITMIIRLYGSYPEGASFAIIIMNILSPRIDYMCMRIFVKKGGNKNA